MRTHPLPPPDSDCVMQDVQPTVVSSFLVLRFRDFGVFVFDLGCFVFEIGCFVFEIWVLRFRVLGASCFGLRFRVLRFRNYPITSRITCNTKSVIYMVQCNRCNLQYIGETKRRLAVTEIPCIHINYVSRTDLTNTDVQSTKLTLNLNPLLFLNTFSLTLTVLIRTFSRNLPLLWCIVVLLPQKRFFERF